MNFKADNIFADYDENGILIIAFSAKKKNEDIYLMIQDAYDRNDKQEIELGTNTYYLEINDQSNAGYGGINEIELSRNLLSIKLDEIGKKNLNLDGQVVSIELEVNNKEFENLTEKLRTIFEPEEKTKTTYNNG